MFFFPDEADGDEDDEDEEDESEKKGRKKVCFQIKRFRGVDQQNCVIIINVSLLMCLTR